MEEMGQAEEFFSKLFEAESWPPRWQCGKWSDFHGWLYIISDLAIWAAYYTIPFLLIHFIVRKKNVPFPRIFWLFGTFILACGTTHLIDAAIFWVPVYRFSALIRFFTALASWATIIALYRILPHAFSLKTPGELERVVAERTDELRSSVKRMRFLADAMPQIVWTARPDGSRDYFNLPTLYYTGKELNELLDWKWVDLIHPDDREEYLKKWEEALNNGSEFIMEKRLRNKEGNYRWHLSRAHPHRDENANILMWVGTATDIEHQKRTAELLEKEVAERTEQLRLANERLLQSNADLENFTAIASHDLQAPLRTISNYLSLVQDNNKEVLDEESNGFINRSVKATARMKQLIENLVSYAKTNASVLTFTMVDLNMVMKDVLENIQVFSESRNARIEADTLPEIEADYTQMNQLFQNIIVNGLKYNNSPQPFIKITAETADDHCTISISDNGQGIEEAYLDKIFEVFTRLQADKQGSGLGLAICKRIVEKHDGSIRVKSEYGKGSTFIVCLPLRQKAKTGI